MRNKETYSKEEATERARGNCSYILPGITSHKCETSFRVFDSIAKSQFSVPGVEVFYAMGGKFSVTRVGKITSHGWIFFNALVESITFDP